MCIQTTSQIKESLLSSFHITPLIADLLLLRNIDTPYKAYAFFNPDLSLCYNPFLLKDMDRAVQIIRKAIAHSQKIGIFADSDIDGLTSLALLSHLFDLLGAKYYYRYPVGDELYGLTLSVIDEFKQNDVEIIITLDSGTRDVNEIAYAKKQGMEVIVCDHHQCADSIPDAIIINPKLPDCPYPFKDLAGVGVVYKLCMAILLSYTKYHERYIIILAYHNGIILYRVIHKGREIVSGTANSEDEIKIIVKNYPDSIVFHYDIKDSNIKRYANFYNIKDFENELSLRNKLIKVDSKDLFPSILDYATMLVHKIQLQQSKKILQFITDMLPLVAVGTVADMMPLVDENRILVSVGISYFEKTNHCGLKVIHEHIAKTINSDTISWDISPLLNTPGRFGKTRLAADFLLEKDISKVKELLQQIIQLNTERKNIIQTLISKFSDNDTSSTIKVICSDEIPEGLTGIIANRLADQLVQPVLVFSDKPDSHIIKGSGRSRNNFDFFSSVSRYEHLFEKLGGHNHAFGFSIKKENIPLLIQELQRTVQFTNTEELIQRYDYELPIEYVTFELLEHLQLFEPYGVGHKPFVFLSRNCTISQYFIINDRHCKLIINGAIKLEGMIWNVHNRYLEILSKNQPVDIIYTVKSNEFNKLISPLLILEEISLSQDLK